MIQTEIGLVFDILTLSDNQKVELLLNHFTPGDGSRGRAEGGEQMEVVFSTGVAN